MTGGRGGRLCPPHCYSPPRLFIYYYGPVIRGFFAENTNDLSVVSNYIWKISICTYYIHNVKGLLESLKNIVLFFFRSMYYCPTQQLYNAKLQKLHWSSQTCQLFIMSTRRNYHIGNLFEEFEFKLSEVKKENQKVNVQDFILRTRVT